MVLNNLYIYLIVRINLKKKIKNKRGCICIVIILFYFMCLYKVLYYVDWVYIVFFICYIDFFFEFKSDCFLKFLINEG